MMGYDEMRIATINFVFTGKQRKEEKRKMERADLVVKRI